MTFFFDAIKRWHVSLGLCKVRTADGGCGRQTDRKKKETN